MHAQCFDFFYYHACLSDSTPPRSSQIPYSSNHKATTNFAEATRTNGVLWSEYPLYSEWYKVSLLSNGFQRKVSMGRKSAEEALVSVVLGILDWLSLISDA